jgi:hypothetical protein
MTSSTGVATAPKRRATSTEQKVVPSRGLCVSCNDDNSCKLRNGNGNGSVHNCEEFNNTVPVENKKNNPEKIQPAKVNSDLRGLCINCEYGETCPNAKCEEGIWHCENYK